MKASRLGQIASAKLQLLALRLYRTPVAQAFVRSSIGERVFHEVYFLYKRAYEAREVERLKVFTKSDAWIIDVGANIGFYTVVFASWLDRGRVLAIEPEPENFRQLQAVVSAKGLSGRVDARQVAAAEHQGPGHLVLSRESHADHRLGDVGLPIRLDTLDSMWVELGRPDVRLIKIDVQGAEHQVLSGAVAVLKACRPALYVEIDASPGQLQIGRPGAILNMLETLGYRPNAWRGAWTSLTTEQAFAEAKHGPSGYADFLFLPT